MESEDLPPDHPLKLILRDINAALNAKLWFMAIAVTLSIPDICSLLELDYEKDGWSKQHKYAAWFDQWVKNKIRMMTGQDCYRLRGGVLHNARFHHPKDPNKRFIFIIPGGHNILVNGAKINVSGAEETVSIYDAKLFCDTIADSAREWAKSKRDDPIVIANLPNLILYRNDGLPAVGRIPLIA